MEEVLKKLNYQPVSLTAQELKHPERVIKFFFDEYPIHTVREHLWDLYKGWTYHTSDFADTEQVTSMICFYTQITALVNASFVYAEKRKDEL